MSFGPGWGGAPLGSAMILNENENEMDVVYGRGGRTRVAGYRCDKHNQIYMRLLNPSLTFYLHRFVMTFRVRTKD